MKASIPAGSDRVKDAFRGVFSDLPRRDGMAALLALSVLGAFASVACSGFVLGYSNNLFHLPIVAGLDREPQFAGDGFVASLRFFAAGPWMLLRGAGHYVDVYWLFFTLNLMSRTLLFLGFLLCGRALGIVRSRDMLILVAVLATSGFMRGGSFAGAGGLYTTMFQHSEIANGLSLLCIHAMIRRRIAAAVALNGAVFFVNAFIAVWNVVPMAILAARLLLGRDLTLRQLLRDGAKGGLVFAAAAAPVVYNVLSNPAYGGALDFSYVEFLKGYFPHHFLIQTMPAHQVLAMGSVVLSAILALTYLGREARPFLAALCGYLVVYGVGCVVGLTSTSPTILNLHLLRVSTFFHLFAALACGVLITRLLSNGRSADAVLWAAVLTLFTSTARALAVAASPVLVAYGFWARLDIGPRLGSRLRTGLVATTLVGAAALALWSIASLHRENARADAVIRQWTAIGDWARISTPPHAAFLVPTADLMHVEPAQAGTRRAFIHEVGTSTFESVSRRRVWVDFKRGAVVMWYPAYHREWRTRLDEVLKLRNLDERLAYAAANGLTHVVEICGGEERPPPAFRTQDLCVFAVSP